jgi:hypothetical protein
MPDLTCFWVASPEPSTRETDPIGTSALHEAAAGVLLPLVSGRTQQAVDYLWVLVGLETASRYVHTDTEIWRFFARFEKALKLYWYEAQVRTSFDGIRAIKVAAANRILDLDFRLLSHQRSQGILGAYIRSLRRAGLIETGSLQLTAAARGLVQPLAFQWTGALTRGWQRHFARAHESLSPTTPIGRDTLEILGQKVLSAPEMVGTVAAIRELGKDPLWRQAASRLKSWPQKETVACCADPLLRLLRAMTEAFWRLLEEPQAPLHVLPLANLADLGWLKAIRGRESSRDPFAEFMNHLRRSPRATKAALIDLHRAVWKARGHDEYWVENRGGQIHVRRDLQYALPLSQATDNWDLRWSVSYQLIRQTHWRLE